jgi:carbon monoxide dehydrogenase subunit G
MRMTGEYRIEAPRETVWAALNDPEVLKRCIAGCEELEKASDTEFTATVKAKVGPVSAKFAGAVTLSDLDPPAGYTITGEGKAGAAGFAKGGAKVALTEDDGATVLTYDVEARIGGKLAQIGSRLVDSTAKKFADDFFGRFAEELAGPAEPEAPGEAAPETGEAPPTGAADAADGDGLAPGIWVTGVFVIVLLLLAIFGLG